MAKPKAVTEQFQDSWNTAVGWAQSNGISANAYIPVYQQDLARLQAGDSIMSAGERNRAIIAAANPNQVTPSPSDNPAPSSILSNARNDLGSIMTGLEPTHLVSGLFDTIKNTAEDVVDPHRLEGANLGTTAANWLQNTLLSFVPGAYDIGTVLRADPNLSGDEGFKALMQHPLVSALDLMPADIGAAGALAKTGLGEALARSGGQTAEQMAEHGTLSALSKVLTNRKTGVMGYAPGNAAAGLQNLTLGDWIQTKLQDSFLNTSKPVQQLMKARMTINQMSTSLYQSIPGPFLDEFKDMTPEEQQQFQQFAADQQRPGADVSQMLMDPKYSIRVRDAWREFSQITRFEGEEAIVEHAGRESDVMPLPLAGGEIRLYSRRDIPAELSNAYKGASEAREIFYQHELPPADALVEVINKTDEAMGQLGGQLDQQRQQAVTAAQHDDALLDNINVEAGGRRYYRGTKKEAFHAVVDSGGYVDQLAQAMKQKDVPLARKLAEIARNRMSKWDVKSIDAGDIQNPAVQALHSQLDKIDQILTQRQKANDDLDDRIRGEAKMVGKLTDQNKEDAARAKKQQHDRHVSERTQAREGIKAEVARLETQRDMQLEQANRTYERMKDNALVRGDNATVRATKAQADATYQQVKSELTQLREDYFKQKNLITARYNEKITAARLDAERAKPKLARKQAQEAKNLNQALDNNKLYHGHLLERMQDYERQLRDFEQAVYDHPSDEYVSAEVELLIKHAMQHTNRAAIIEETDKAYREAVAGDESRVTKLHENAELMGEMVWGIANDIYKNPVNYDPALWGFAKQMVDEVHQSALDELNTLIAQGFKPQWIHKVDSATHPVSAIKAAEGKGTPTVSSAMGRIHDLTGTRHDAVLGAAANLAEVLQRDATIEMVDQYLTPLAIKGSKLKTQLMGMSTKDDSLQFENLDLSKGTHLDALTAKAAQMGLRKFDPESLFGFSFPRWENEALYLPEGLVSALDKMKDLEKRGNKGLFDKVNQVFRYSILGLSPRYTAHILFGGTFLLALRSTPYMPLMILKAAKMMKDGTLPEKMFRTPPQEGFQRFQFALQEHAWASGDQMALLVKQEHIEQVQGVALHKASPIHYLKAAADKNFRFTRYVQRMQTSIAYLDYMSRAERRGYFTDPLTGEVVQMTKARAMEEGMQHVEQVFGDLRSMSPFERQVAKNIMPFYGWTRHILKYVVSMPVDHPWRAMVLALIAYENSADVPKGLPERIQFLFFLGAPDAQGNVTAVDDRFMNPLRDVANYATLGGWIQGLNPIFQIPAAMTDPNLVYGATSLYPNLSYNQFYGIETAGAQGTAVQGLSQLIPQLGAVQPMYDAMTNAAHLRELKTDPNAFWKNVFESLNIPFAQIQKINLKQIAASDEIARYEVAKQVSQNAFDSGDFSALQGYASVPNPLNPDYEMTPAELEALYNSALVEYPGAPPSEVLTPPTTPYGF